MSKKVLITGGAGFVGSHLADGLLRRGDEVSILDNLTPQVHGNKLPEYIASEVKLIRADIRDRTAVRDALNGIDVVFHFAAAVGVGQSMYEISRYIGTNTLGTAELLQAVLDSKRMPEKLIVASSMSIYGEGRYACTQCRAKQAPPIRPSERLKDGKWELHCEICGGILEPVPTDEEKPSVANSVYALSKRDQEELCLIFGRTYQVPVTALRFFNIYGTRQALSNPYTGVAANFASRLINGQAPLIFEDGRQMRDFVNVRDIVHACILAMQRPESDGEAMNIGSGIPINICGVADLLARTLEKDIAPVITGKYRAGDIRHCYADISKARRLLGYEPQVTHEAGFSELASWIAGQEAEDNCEVMLKELTAYKLTA